MSHAPPGDDRGAAWVWMQAPVLIALVASGPLRPGDWHHPTAVALGLLLFVVGGALGIWGVVLLGRNRTPFPKPRPGSALVTRGPYAWVRHPLYSSLMVSGLGWALMWQSGAGLTAALVTALFFDAKARREERLLDAAFPGYADYCRRVKRFLPGLY